MGIPNNVDQRDSVEVNHLLEVDVASIVPVNIVDRQAEVRSIGV